jgi:hypothetical protein
VIKKALLSLSAPLSVDLLGSEGMRSVRRPSKVSVILSSDLLGSFVAPYPTFSARGREVGTQTFKGQGVSE